MSQCGIISLGEYGPTTAGPYLLDCYILVPDVGPKEYINHWDAEYANCEVPILIIPDVECDPYGSIEWCYEEAVNWYRTQLSLQVLQKFGNSLVIPYKPCCQYCDFHGQAGHRHPLYYEYRYYKATVWFTLRDISSRVKLGEWRGFDKHWTLTN